MWLIVAFAIHLLVLIQGSEETHHYKEGEEVVIWVNKVGPYHNPQETYHYYQLPFCRPERMKTRKVRHTHNSLGAILEGNDLQDSGLSIKFKVDDVSVPICDLDLTVKRAKLLSLAIKNHYWYQMYIDELPIWGMVGQWVEENENGKKKGQALVYTHKAFAIGYNGNQVIEVNLTSENPRPVLNGEKYPMTYSVVWKETNTPFDRRFDRYLDFDFFEHQIHWFSMVNSFMMVVFLCGIVALILMRTLRNDYVRYTSEDDDLEVDRVVEESGWKQVHGDVFRAPSYLSYLSALIGTGYQLLSLAFMLIIFTLLDSSYDERGTIMTTFIICYSLTAAIAGYTSASHFKLHGGKDWKKAMLLTGTLFPGFCFLMIILLNVVAVSYNSTASFSASAVFSITTIWILVSCPLILAGTVIGRAMTTEKDFPCRINSTRRPIPDGKWYTRPVTLVLLSGILPFGTIFIEMYLVFTSLWNYKFYYVYGFMLVVYCILIIVTICVTIVGTYFLLNAEDYRWQWTSFCSGGSTAIYVFLYAIYYFSAKTRMSGALQTSFYFAYMSIFCAALFILGGTIAHLGTNLFVRRIYMYIKSD